MNTQRCQGAFQEPLYYLPEGTRAECPVCGQQFDTTALIKLSATNVVIPWHYADRVREEAP